MTRHTKNVLPLSEFRKQDLKSSIDCCRHLVFSCQSHLYFLAKFSAILEVIFPAPQSTKSIFWPQSTINVPRISLRSILGNFRIFSLLRSRQYLSDDVSIIFGSTVRRRLCDPTQLFSGFLQFDPTKR